MNYPTRCTWCASLLKNIGKYKNNHIYNIEKEIFIDVETREESNLITQMNGHQEATFKIYNELLK